MLGLHAFSAAPLSTLTSQVHALCVLEGMSCTVDVRITLGVAVRVLINASGSTQDSGPLANGRGVQENLSTGELLSALGGMGLSAAEQAEAVELLAAQFANVPLYIVEGTVSEDQPPFARQRWEFVRTSTGGQWTPVQTGD